MVRKPITPSDPALPMHYPGFVFRTLRGDGVAAEALLGGTGLTESLLCDPDFRCDFSKHSRLYMNAIELADDPHIGVRLAQRFRASYAGLPFLTAMNAATFNDALVTLSRLLALTFPALEFTGPTIAGGEDSQDCGFHISPKVPLGEIAYFGMSSALVVCDGLFRELLQLPKITLRAEIAMAKPDGWDEVARELTFPIRFDTGHVRLIFPAALLRMPLPASDPINHLKLLHVCDQLAGHSDSGDTPVRQVLAFLKDSRNLNASCAKVADRLGYSERGLRRQLARNGTSYRELLKQARERMALERLVNHSVPVQAIAFELGFDTPSNFARSFKDWTGVTPTEYRARQAGQVADGQN